MKESRGRGRRRRREGSERSTMPAENQSSSSNNNSTNNNNNSSSSKSDVGDGEVAKPVSRVVKTGGAMLGGAIEACCLQPLDVLKTRMQLGGAKAGLFNVATTTVKEEGFRALYKGLTPFILHLVTKYSVRW